MDNTKKTKVIMGISIGVIVLVLIFGLVIGIIQAKSQNLTSDTKAAPDKDQINTVGNTPANLMHGGLATTQGDKFTISMVILPAEIGLWSWIGMGKTNRNFAQLKGNYQGLTSLAINYSFLIEFMMATHMLAHHVSARRFIV